MSDTIRYDLLVQDALRGVVRKVLANVAREGLPGDHHFFITFNTHAPGVHLSDAMRKQYPEEITIVLQHQFWDLTIDDTHFEVGLSFRNIPEKLSVPFSAITGFSDPSAQFALRFDMATENADPAATAETSDAPAPQAPTPLPMRQSDPPSEGATEDATTGPTGKNPRKSRKNEPAAEDGQKGDEAPAAESGNVVSIDAFRKKN